jgi:positive regulator of sigma E activity
MAFLLGFISAYKDEISAVTAAFLAFITLALAFIAYHQYKRKDSCAHMFS